MNIPSLKRLNAELVKADTQPNRVTLLIRANNQQAWTDFVREYLTAAIGKAWKPDLSKVFFVADGGVVRFLWRIVVTGEIADGIEQIHFAAVRCLASNVEVKSMPLVGRETYAPDPATGKIKGAFDERTASALRSRAVGGG